MAKCSQRGTSPSRIVELRSGTQENQDKISAEQRWFDTDYSRPGGIPVDVCSCLNDMDDFKALIWEQPARDVISRFGCTAEEMADLTGTGWLSTGHIVWLLDRVNEAQDSSLCQCLSVSNPDLFRKMVKGCNMNQLQQLIFVANVGKTTNEVYFATPQKPGNHWVLITVDMSDKPVVKYCDSLAWAPPSDLLQHLSQYMQVLGLSLNEASVNVMHVPQSPGYNHTCRTSCRNYPLQACSDMCGVLVVVCAVVAALDSCLFQELTGPRSGLRLFFHEPTKYQHYLRRVLICWFMNGAIDIALLQTQTHECTSLRDCESNQNFTARSNKDTQDHMDSGDLQLGRKRKATYKAHTDTKRNSCNNQTQLNASPSSKGNQAHQKINQQHTEKQLPSPTGHNSTQLQSHSQTTHGNVQQINQQQTEKQPPSSTGHNSKQSYSQPHPSNAQQKNQQHTEKQPHSFTGHNSKQTHPQPHPSNAQQTNQQHTEKQLPSSTRHNLKEKHSNQTPLICQFCNKEYKNKKALFAHKKKVHPAEYNKTSNSETGNSSCEMCAYKCSRIRQLIKHYNSEHQLKLRIFNRTFTSEEDFSEWRKNVEKETHSQFIKHCGTNIIKETIQCKRFYCHRSGTYRSQLQVRKRAQKSIGPCKMGRNCTAYMSTRKDIRDGSVRVEYCLQHTGHDFQLGHLKISDETRAHIAGKLNQGLEPNKLLCDLRENMTVMNRDSLIRSKDLLNIKKQFNITRTAKHKDDLTSVGLWVEELGKEDNNPIICFKEQNTEHKCLQMEDFLLCIQTKFQKEMMKEHASKIILMDSIHDTNQYDFYLTTILVLDEYQQSIPVAWAISNREDANILQVFMEAVRSHCDQTFETDYFMSDLADNFYSAWCQVFSKPKQRLYCDWHLDRAWRQIALKIVKDHELTQKIYQHIKALQQVLDESEFRKCLQGFLAYIKLLVPAFHTYFDNSYVSEGKISQWAHCFRVNSPTNSNMHAESFYRVLKTNYNRKQNKRVDNLVCILLKIAKDKETDQLMTKKMGTMSSHMIEIGKRHRDAEKIAGMEERNAEEDEEIIEWIVPSSSGHNQIYRVTQNSNQPCGCKLVCYLCSSCVHMYNCTCEDFRCKKVICKHIHAVHMAFNRDRQQNAQVEQQHDQQETVDNLDFDNGVLIKNEPESSNNDEVCWW